MKAIIESLLDIDFYKFTMGQLIFLRHPAVPVKFAFKNRTKSVKIAEGVDMHELREHLDYARTLRFRNSELHYLRGTNEYQERMFYEDYLESLRTLVLPEYLLEDDGNGGFRLEFEGKWSEVTYWETIALSIVNQLYFSSLLKKMSRFERDMVFANGRLRLAEKIRKLREHPEISFTDFGTRRRFSRQWQQYVVQTMAEELPKQFRGTSNTMMAMLFNLLPMGTCAHEMDQGYSGIYHNSDDEIRSSHQRLLDDWWKQYGWGLSIALTDTFGTDFFFRDFTLEQARNWKGLRQDSGDPFKFGEKAIRFYESHGVDPKSKLLIFSDGLDVDTIIRIHDSFRNRINVTFGWGTDLTNDLGFKPLSLVIKVVEANSHGAVKLSDNLAKAIGQAEDIERFKRIFGYTATTYLKCRF